MPQFASLDDITTTAKFLNQCAVHFLTIVRIDLNLVADSESCPFGLECTYVAKLDLLVSRVVALEQERLSVEGADMGSMVGRVAEGSERNPTPNY